MLQLKTTKCQTKHKEQKGQNPSKQKMETMLHLKELIIALWGKKSGRPIF